MILSAFLPILLLEACAPARMAVPQDLTAKTEAMPVTRKKFWYIFDLQRMNFGKFVVSDFNQGWTHGTNWSVDVYSSSKYKQRYGFTLKPEEGPDWRCDCGAKASQKALEGNLLGGRLTIPLEQRTSLTCNLKDSENGIPWTLELTKNGMRTSLFAGELSDGKKHLQVESTDRIEGFSFPSDKPMGYIFRDGEHVLGAVGTVNKEQVWIGPDAGADMRPQLAAVATALLVYQDLQEEIEGKNN